MIDLKRKPDYALLHEVLESPYLFGIMTARRFYKVVKNLYQYTDKQLQVLYQWVENYKEEA